MTDILTRLDAAIGGPDRRTRDGRVRKMTPMKIETQLLIDAKAEMERLQKEIVLRKAQQSREPFCPDHRDKVRGLPCRECEIERLRGLLRVCMRRWIPFKEVDFRRTVMEAAQCNQNGDEP